MPLTYTSDAQLKTLLRSKSNENGSEAFEFAIRYGFLWYLLQLLNDSLIILRLKMGHFKTFDKLKSVGVNRVIFSLLEIPLYLTICRQRYKHAGKVCGGDYVTETDHSFDDYINRDNGGNLLWWTGLIGWLYVGIFSLFLFCLCCILPMALICKCMKQRQRKARESLIDEYQEGDFGKPPVEENPEDEYKALCPELAMEE
jgi:hypothetical protein